MGREQRMFGRVVKQLEGLPVRKRWPLFWAAVRSGLLGQTKFRLWRWLLTGHVSWRAR